MKKFLITFGIIFACSVPGTVVAENTHATDLVKASSQNWYKSGTSALNMTSQWTYAAWVNADNVSTVNAQILMAGSADTDGDCVYEGSFDNSKFFRVGVDFQHDGDRIVGIVNDVQTSKSYTIDPDTWYHVAVRFDGTQASGSRFEFYINGTSIGEGSSTQTSVTEALKCITIGTEEPQRSESSSHRYFDGQIDDVRMWTRALSDSEIYDIYNDPCTASNNGSNLGGWWKFDNNGNDDSGNGNNLTAMNSPTFSASPAFMCGNPPSAASGLLVEGQTNPTDIQDANPQFSAIYNDPDASDIATHYQMQISTLSDFSSIFWDSTKTILASSTSQGSRIQDITYNGTALASLTTYYWRIKFWDDEGNQGQWSTSTDSFSVAPMNTQSTDLVKASSQAWYDLSPTELDATTAWTGCAWLNRDDVPAVNVNIVFTVGENRYGFYTSPTIVAFINDVQTSSGTSVANNVWTHVCVRYNGSLSSANRVEFYVDGSSLGEFSNSQSSVSGSGNFEIGTGDITRNEASSHRYFDGQIDDVRVWTRALSDSEIEAIYNDRGNAALNGTDLGGWWKFDGSGVDSSGNGNDLSALNSPAFSNDLPYVCGAPPSAPTGLYTEGQTNPIDVIDSTPEFSAIFENPYSCGVGKKYQVQVGAAPTITSNLIWDSGKTDMASTSVGDRISDISYASTTLSSADTYFWRVRFWDNSNSYGPWSATSTFRMLQNINGVQNISFGYDDVGNIIQIADRSDTGAGKVVNYSYDDLYRLTFASTTVASSTPYKHIFAYSSIGNLTGMATSSATTSYSYAGTSHANPHAPTTIGSGSYSYDNNGNLTSGGGFTNTWDWRNRLTQTVKGTTTRYMYDHTFERVKYQAGTDTTIYANDLYSVSTSTGKITKNIYMNGELIATVESGNVPTTTYYVHPDHLGGTNATTNASGTLTHTLDYYPYGETRIDTGTDIASREYIGEIKDEDTNLSYLNARYYDGSRGQFLSQDPVFWEAGQTDDGYSALMNPQLQNSYSYAGNNPITNKDPDGRFLETGLDIAMFAVSVGTFISDPSWTNAAGVVLDGASVALPGIPAVGGVAVRAAKYGEKAAEAVEAVEKASDASRVGKPFTPKGKAEVINANKAKNQGMTTCENCGTKTVPGQKSQKGVTPPKNETQVDHVVPQSKGGSGTPSNGQVLCRDCNIRKSNR